MGLFQRPLTFKANRNTALSEYIHFCVWADESRIRLYAHAESFSSLFTQQGNALLSYPRPFNFPCSTFFCPSERDMLCNISLHFFKAASVSTFDYEIIVSIRLNKGSQEKHQISLLAIKQNSLRLSQSLHANTLVILATLYAALCITLHPPVTLLEACSVKFTVHYWQPTFRLFRLPHTIYSKVRNK